MLNFDHEFRDAEGGSASARVDTEDGGVAVGGDAVRWRAVERAIRLQLCQRRQFSALLDVGQEMRGAPGAPEATMGASQPGDNGAHDWHRQQSLPRVLVELDPFGTFAPKCKPEFGHGVLDKIVMALPESDQEKVLTQVFKFLDSVDGEAPQALGARPPQLRLGARAGVVATTAPLSGGAGHRPLPEHPDRRYRIAGKKPAKVIDGDVTKLSQQQIEDLMRLEMRQQCQRVAQKFKEAAQHGGSTLLQGRQVILSVNACAQARRTLEAAEPSLLGCAPTRKPRERSGAKVVADSSAKARKRVSAAAPIEAAAPDVAPPTWGDRGAAARTPRKRSGSKVVADSSAKTRKRVSAAASTEATAPNTDSLTSGDRDTTTRTPRKRSGAKVVADSGAATGESGRRPGAPGMGRIDADASSLCDRIAQA